MNREQLFGIQEKGKSTSRANQDVLTADFIEFEATTEAVDSGRRPRRENSSAQGLEQQKLTKKTNYITSLLRFNVPWMDQRRSYSSFPIERLHQEIVDFSNYVSPMEEERFSRSEAIRRLSEVVTLIWPSATVHIFGSFDSQLYLPSSDLDVVILHEEENEQADYYKKSPLGKLAKALLRAGIPIPESVNVITKARVPIIKYVDKLTEFELDVSYNVTSGVEAAKIMQKEMKARPAIRPLTLVLKHFLQMRALNEVFHGGLGSFSIMCLVISFLQVHPLVQSGLIRAHENLGVLLLEFFELYGKRFNSEVVGIDISNEGLYFRKEEFGWLQESRPHIISIRDPQNEENDISKGSYAYGTVKQSFDHAFNVLRHTMKEFERYNRSEEEESSYNNNNNRRRRNSPRNIPSILGSIIALDPKLLRHRFYIQQTSNL